MGRYLALQGEQLQRLFNRRRRFLHETQLERDGRNVLVRQKNTRRPGTTRSRFSFSNTTFIFTLFQLLLALETNNETYRRAVETFCNYAIKKQKRTPRGLIFIDPYGTLAYAANIAFVCLKVSVFLLLKIPSDCFVLFLGN